jgi:hypothetical protein
MEFREDYFDAYLSDNDEGIMESKVAELNAFDTLESDLRYEN